MAHPLSFPGMTGESQPSMAGPARSAHRTRYGSDLRERRTQAGESGCSHQHPTTTGIPASQDQSAAPRRAPGTGSPALGKVLLGMGNGNVLAAATQEALEEAWKVAKISLTSFLKGASRRIVGPAMSPPRPWVLRKQNITGKLVTETR